MKQISFFRHKRSRTSNLIRADQISEFISAKINPIDGYENDVCIYVKQFPLDHFPENSYFDINDLYPCLPWILEHPTIKVITISRVEQRYVSTSLKRDDVILIPQHHCNYLREQREREDVMVAGVIGGNRAYEGNREELSSMLKDIGVEYIDCIHPRTRQEVVEFYKKIDVQLTYRPRRSTRRGVKELGSSLKLINAGSFGIPTVCYPEPTYVDEFEGCFLSSLTVSDLVSNVAKLKEDRML